MSEQKPKMVGQECPCGVAFQHIHLKEDGLKKPIPIVKAVEAGLLEEPFQQGEWESRFIQEFGIHFSKSELQFVLDFIKELLQQAYKDGYNTCLKDFKIKNDYGEKSL